MKRGGSGEVWRRMKSLRLRDGRRSGLTVRRSKGRGLEVEGEEVEAEVGVVIALLAVSPLDARRGSTNRGGRGRCNLRPSYEWLLRKEGQGGALRDWGRLMGEAVVTLSLAERCARRLRQRILGTALRAKLRETRC